MHVRFRFALRGLADLERTRKKKRKSNDRARRSNIGGQTDILHIDINRLFSSFSQRGRDSIVVTDCGKLYQPRVTRKCARGVGTRDCNNIYHKLLLQLKCSCPTASHHPLAGIFTDEQHYVLTIAAAATMARFTAWRCNLIQ